MSDIPVVAPYLRRARVRRISRREREVLARAREVAEGMENTMFAEMYVTALEKRIYDNDETLYNFLKELETTPVSIETFLDSPEYLGATDMVIWPEVREAIIAINKDWWRGSQCRTSMVEAVLAGATGTGKTSISIITTMYHLHLLGCMRQPQTYFGLPRATSIVFPIMAANPNVTKKVVYMPLRKMVEEVPWFSMHMRMDKQVESEIYFEEKNIRVYVGGADSDSLLGEAVIGGVIDEINFMNVVLRSKKAEVSTGRAGVYDQAQTTYDTMSRRKKSRFIKQGPSIGIVCVASSTRYKNDFTDRRMAHIREHDEKHVYVYCKKQYEVQPKSKYSGETFRLLVGNEALSDTRVLEDNEVVPDNALVLDVPVEYRMDFVKNPHDALRDIVGISTSSVHPFFRRRFKILEAIQLGEEDGLQSFLEKDNVILGIHDMPTVKSGHYCADPSRPRYVHIDLSLTGDRCIAEGQRVLMADRRYIAIEQVRAGDTVVTHNGTLETVTAVHDNGVKEVLDVSVYGWPEPLRATASHKVWAVRREAISYADGRLVKPSDKMFSGRSAKAARKRYNYSPEFVELGELRVGDFLVTPRPDSVEHYNIHGVPLCYGTGYIAGIFAAEGSYYLHHGSEYVQFSLHENEVRIVSQLSAYLREYFGVSVRVCRDKRSKAVTVRTRKSDTLVSFLLAAVGEYSDRKHLDCASMGDRVFQAGVAHGYVDGDGHVRYSEDGRPKALRTKTVSRKMAESFYWLLVANGFSPVLGSEEEHVDSRGVAHRRVFYVSLSGEESMRKFEAWTIGSVDIPCSRVVAMPTHILTPIVDVRDGGETRVYDITVGDTHSYIVGNTAVHNCGIGMVRFDGLRDVEREGGVTESLPECTVELACSIEPDAQNEIQIAEVRSWVKQLRDRYGYPIKVVTYDGYIGRESIQQWRKEGMKTGNFSVDRTSVPYKQFRDAINDNRVKMYNNEVLTKELFDLEYDSDKDKVDHPPTSSKDVADAVCSAYCVMLERRASWVQAAADDEASLAALRRDFDARVDEARRE